MPLKMYGVGREKLTCSTSWPVEKKGSDWKRAGKGISTRKGTKLREQFKKEPFAGGVQAGKR